MCNCACTCTCSYGTCLYMYMQLWHVFVHVHVATAFLCACRCTAFATCILHVHVHYTCTCTALYYYTIMYMQMCVCKVEMVYLPGLLERSASSIFKAGNPPQLPPRYQHVLAHIIELRQYMNASIVLSTNKTFSVYASEHEMRSYLMDLWIYSNFVRHSANRLSH